MGCAGVVTAQAEGTIVSPCGASVAAKGYVALGAKFDAAATRAAGGGMMEFRGFHAMTEEPWVDNGGFESGQSSTANVNLAAARSYSGGNVVYPRGGFAEFSFGNFLGVDIHER